MNQETQPNIQIPVHAFEPNQNTITQQDIQKKEIEINSRRVRDTFEVVEDLKKNTDFFDKYILKDRVLIKHSIVNELGKIAKKNQIFNIYSGNGNVDIKGSLDLSQKFENEMCLFERLIPLFVSKLDNTPFDLNIDIFDSKTDKLIKEYITKTNPYNLFDV